jgi:hypothetical protein
MLEIAETILSAGPRSRILLLPLPRFDRMRENLKEARFLGGMGVCVMRKCEDVWKAAPLCPSLTSEWPPKRKALVSKALQAYNAALARITEKLRARFGDRIRLAASLVNLEIGPNDVSIDCFHPNYTMQNRVAQDSWKYSWWAGQEPAR